MYLFKTSTNNSTMLVVSVWRETLVSRALFLLCSCNLSQFLFQRDNVNLDENLGRVLNFYYYPIMSLVFFMSNLLVFYELQKCCILYWQNDVIFFEILLLNSPAGPTVHFCLCDCGAGKCQVTFNRCQTSIVALHIQNYQPELNQQTYQLNPSL